MNHRAAILISTLAAALAGCGVHPMPGTAAAVLKVTAEPKAGFVDPTAGGFSDLYGESVGALAGPLQMVDYMQLDDIIVWLTPAAEAAMASGQPTPAMELEVHSNRAGVWPVSVGQTLSFRNSGDTAVSVFCVSDGNEFDLPPIAAGGTASVVVRAAGTMEILTDPARPPIATLYAVNSPWVVRTESGRTVVFNNLPPGVYAAHAWHPRLPGSSAQLTLPVDQVTQASLSVSVNNLSPRR